MPSTDKIILRSSDGESFEVEKKVTLQFRHISQMIKETDSPAVFPLPNVTSKILSMVIEYCEMHVDDTDLDSSVAGDDLKAWDADFVKVDAATLFNHILILSKIIAYCRDLRAWDAEFVNVDKATLFDLILAANYLDIKGLLDLTCQTVNDMIKSLPPEELRKSFSIRNNFEPEEEEEVRKENQWAFE